MTRPYYQDDSVTLYGGDALAVLRELPTASVDALITDPPYSSGGMVRGDRAGVSTKSKYVTTQNTQRDTLVDFSGDNRDQRAYAYWCTLWLAECLRIVKPGGIGMLFTDWRQLPSTTDALQSGGWVWRGIVPWYKPDARPMSGRFTSSCEYVVWGSAGPMPLDWTLATFPGFYQSPAPRAREHITQKPLDIMRELVKITPAGGVILDPFTGSGTTGAAAALEGRKFIGVEKVDHYLRVAQRRILTAHGQQVAAEEQGSLDFGEPA